MQNRNSKIFKNTSSLYLRTLITLAIGFYSARLTLEILGVDDYGLYNLVGSIVVLFSFLNKSMGTSVQRFYSIAIGEKNEENLTKIFNNSLIIHSGIAIVTILLLEILAFSFIGKLNIPPERLFAAKVVFQISVITFALKIINVPYSALLNAKEDFSKKAFFEILQSVLRLGLLFLLNNIGYDKLIGYAILQFLVSMLLIFAVNQIVKKYNVCKISFQIDKSTINKMLSFSSIYLSSVFFRLLKDQGIIMLINLFFGLAINAAYAVANQVRSYVLTFSMNFRISVVPQLMNSYGEKDMDRMNRLLFTASKLTNYLFLLIILPLIFEASFLLKVWLKNPPKGSAIFVSLLVINEFIVSLSYFLLQAIHATGKIKKYTLFQIISYGTTIILIYVFLNKGSDYYSVIYINMFISILMFCVSLFFAKKLINININNFIIEVISPCLYIILLVSLILYIINIRIDTSLIRLIITFSCSTLITGILIYFTGLNSYEKDIIGDFLKKNRNLFSSTNNLKN